MRSQRGMTLVAMLVGMTVPAVVLGGVTGLTQSSRRSSERSLDPVAAQLVSRGGCAAPVAARDQQPLVVYASSFRFGFETDCAAGGASDQLANYRNTAAADTLTFFFQADSTTRRTDDFVLMRQAQGQRPAPVLQNVLAYPGRPFFQYYYRKTVEAGRRTTHPVPASWLPLQHTAVRHGAAADTGIAARIDTLRAVEVNYSITNGRTGAAEQIEQVSIVVALATLNSKQGRPCDDEPFFSQASLVRSASRQQLAADANLARNAALPPAERGACYADGGPPI